MSHTPGPWEMSGPMGTGPEYWYWVSAGRTLHLKVQVCPDGFVFGENEANARLIAAAPDLLAALKNARAFIYGTPSNQLPIGWEIDIDAAIAKAQGVQHG